MKLEDLPLASEKELAMARGEGRPDGVAGIMAGIAGLGGVGAGVGTAGELEHRPLEEAFVMEGARIAALKGFVQEDFGLVFDEVSVVVAGGRDCSTSLCCVAVCM